MKLLVRRSRGVEVCDWPAKVYLGIVKGGRDPLNNVYHQIHHRLHSDPFHIMFLFIINKFKPLTTILLLKEPSTIHSGAPTSIARSDMRAVPTVHSTLPPFFNHTSTF